MRISGIVLIRNEDLYIERVLSNIRDFCDDILVLDNHSRDRTWDIVSRMAEADPRIRAERIADTRDSHARVSPLAGSDTWVFAVDGDEIYDPAGLARFRRRLLAGELSQCWQVYGNVLNCTGIDTGARRATGYLAPPCRSMVKLYNFAAIDAWEGPCTERLLGGHIHFRDGFGLHRRCHLHQETSWDEAELRCLHLCFVRRSSLDRADGARDNIVEVHARRGPLRRARWLLSQLRRDPKASWKREKYMRGALVEKDVSAFLP